MEGTVAVTDAGWYNFLRRQQPPEVNFWTPSDRRGFRAPLFSPFFFKLKAPHNAICGLGFFARWTSLPDWLAWDCFGEGNGCASFQEMQERIGAIRRRIGYVADGPGNIGCILLVQPTFFPPEQWIPQPVDWHARTVTSKAYDLTMGEGRRIWEEALARLPAAPELREGVELTDLSLVAEPSPQRYGTPRAVAPRLGQGTFRVAVTDAYERACAVTGEHSLPALEAAHIRSYAHDGPHDVRNGLLLRADLHRLFDLGYLTVTPERRLEVSRRLREDYSNGRSYYPLHGQELRTPAREADRPAAECLRWHNQNVYRG
jgi:putative restriction endonuclease